MFELKTAMVQWRQKYGKRLLKKEADGLLRRQRLQKGTLALRIYRDSQVQKKLHVADL